MLLASLLVRLGYSKTCERLSDPVCFPGLPTLAYNWTAFSLADDSLTTDDVRDRLDQWYGLSAVPSCWNHAANFLCKLYKPECDNQTGSVRLPCRERCLEMKEYCGVVEQTRPWPTFTNCSLFPSCGNVSASKVSKQIGLDKRCNKRDLSDGQADSIVLCKR